MEMEVEYTNEMLVEIVKETLDRIKVDQLISVKIERIQDKIVFELSTTKLLDNKISVKTGDKMKITI